MKVLLVVLAVACAAFAAPEIREKREIDFNKLKDSCPGKCFDDGKYREKFTRMAPTGKAAAKKFASAQKPTVAVPDVSQAEWQECCQDVDKVKTCVEKCNDPKDAEIKQKAITILTSLKDLACDKDIQANIACLGTIDNDNVQVPAECNVCDPIKNELVTKLNQSMNTEGFDWEKAKAVATSVCKYTTCNLKCFKPVVEQKCQAAGYNALKTLTKKSAALVQTVHGQFRPPGNFPNECKPDAIVAGA